MLRIAICDDDIFICHELRSIIRMICEINEYEYTISVFTDGEFLIKSLSDSQHFDIIFLDVVMKKLSGIQTGKIIRDQYHDEKSKIIFISAIKDYVFEAFDARPVNYIIKPLDKDKVEAVLKKTLTLIEEERGVFVYKSGHFPITVYLSDIQYFESALRKIRIVTLAGSEEYYGTMSDLLEMNLHGFIQIHRSFLINTGQISEYKYTSVKMNNGDELSVSQNKKSEVMDILTKITLTKLKER